MISGVSRGGLALIGASAALSSIANLMMRRVVAGVGTEGNTTVQMRAWMGVAQRPSFVLAWLLYGVAVVLWFRVLASEQVTSSYPVLVGLTFLFVTSGAVVALNETVSMLKISGMGFILLGILMVSRG